MAAIGLMHAPCLGRDCREPVRVGDRALGVGIASRLTGVLRQAIDWFRESGADRLERKQASVGPVIVGRRIDHCGRDV